MDAAVARLTGMVVTVMNTRGMRIARAAVASTSATLVAGLSHVAAGGAVPAIALSLGSPLSNR